MSDIEDEMTPEQYQEYLDKMNANTVEEVSAEELKDRQDIQKEIYNVMGNQFKLDIANEMITRCNRAISDIIFFKGIYGDKILTVEILRKRIKKLLDHINALPGDK